MEEARTRIVCTIGPASSSSMLLARMMRAGMDIARLNFSHGTHDEHAALARALRVAAKKTGKTIALLQDLQGIKIRVGTLPKSGVVLRAGQTVTLTTTPLAYIATLQHIPVTYHTLHKDIEKDHRVFIDDGAIELSVLRVNGRNIHCSVDVGGTVLSHKGINVPDTFLSASTILTKKDRDDARFGTELGVDWIAVSFVTSPKILRALRVLVTDVARKEHRRPPRIMAKIECAPALRSLDAIIAEADGILLGRGDLGVEIAPAEVPLVQKDVAERCRRAGKPCIIATHMLESMQFRPRATRAEISDVANAVFDHVDGVMLSAESATGHYPAAAVQAMAEAIAAAENSHWDQLALTATPTENPGEALGQALALLSEGQGMSAILMAADFPEAHAVLAYRPSVPLGMLVPDAQAARQVVPYWGVVPIVADMSPATLPLRARNIAKTTWRLPRGSRVALLLGSEKGGVQLSIFTV